MYCQTIKILVFKWKSEFDYSILFVSASLSSIVKLFNVLPCLPHYQFAFLHFASEQVHVNQQFGCWSHFIIHGWRTMHVTAHAFVYRELHQTSVMDECLSSTIHKSETSVISWRMKSPSLGNKQALGWRTAAVWICI